MKFPVRWLVLVLALVAVAACSDDDPVATEGAHTFVYVPHAETPAITSITVRGTFQGEGMNWTDQGQLAMVEQADGSWEVTTELDPGTYEYKYLFNGPDGWSSNMCADPTWGNPPGGAVVPGLTQCTGEFNNAVLVID